MSGPRRTQRHYGDDTAIRDRAPGAAPALETVSVKRNLELQSLYQISELVEKYADSLPRILEGIVEILPTAWLHPDCCRARITLRGECYETQGFRESSLRQSASVRVQGSVVGLVEVVYVKTPPRCGDGPFLPEEQALLDAVATRIGRTAERCQLRDELARTHTALFEAKAGLRSLFSQIEEEKAEVGRAIRANVERVLLPQIRAIANQLPSGQRECLTFIEQGLADLTNPFTHTITESYRTLTAAEIEICDLIRRGKSTKEIAQIRHVTPATVFKQRESIRRKLRIAGSDANLTAHLLAINARTGKQ